MSAIVPAKTKHKDIFDDEIWTVEDVADAFKVSRRTVANWTRDRRIPHLKLGRLVRFRQADVMCAMTRFVVREVGSSPPTRFSTHKISHQNAAPWGKRDV
ncbi:MAG: helix-turn-helix domain-containing protein [Chthoniobacterales bacterium]|nr:helix-turn-helix domain-containing protein [Chthoniobacterales bacterium]